LESFQLSSRLAAALASRALHAPAPAHLIFKTVRDAVSTLEKPVQQDEFLFMSFHFLSQIALFQELMGGDPRGEGEVGLPSGRAASPPCRAGAPAAETGDWKAR
jgi:hypothetical protein